QDPGAYLHRGELMRLGFFTMRSGFILAHLVLLVALVGEALGQARTKVWRIGYLGDGTATARAAEIRQFRAGMAELGYVEGRNLVIVERWTEDSLERRAALAAELAGMNPDVIVTHGVQAARAVKSATATTPIVVAV